MTNALKVLVVRDGRPGHEKQSFGIVAALRERFEVELREYVVRPGYKALQQAFFLFVHTCPRELTTFHPDIIIGAGSHTHLPILALQRRLGGRTVVCMSPMKLLRNRFDLCCIPRHDGIPESENILLTDGPPGLNCDHGRHESSQALVLVGGIDEKSHNWDSEGIARDIVAVVQKHPQLNWTLTTSPRTPSDFLEVFSRQQTSLLIRLCPFDQTPRGWLEQELQKNDWVLVTEDSLSMIFEALSAGCRVATVPVLFNSENKFVRCIKDLKRRGVVADSINSTGTRKESERFNEAARCTDFMQQQPWWPLP